MSILTRIRQQSDRRFVPQVPLVVLLLLPLLYYPVANGILIPFFASNYPRLEESSRAIVASGVALLVILTFLASLLIHHSDIALPNFGLLLSRPETWLVLALLWLIPITLMDMQPTSTQNFIVYIVVIVILLQCYFGTQLISRTLAPITLVLSGVLILAGFVGLWTPRLFLVIGSNPRLYATYGVMAMCLMFAIEIRNRIRFPFIILLYASIVVSQSRTALVAALFVGALGIVFNSSRPWFTSLGVFVGALAIFAVTLNLPTISSRMAPSEITTAGAPIDDSGRIVVWRAVADSFNGSPVVGQGAGSGQTVALASDFPLEHPHSEYLRVLHDGGIIGAVLVGVALILMLVLLRPRRNGVPSHPHIVGGFLLLCAGLSMGTIENFLVFPSLMWPGAVILGLALSTQRRPLHVTRYQGTVPLA